MFENVARDEIVEVVATAWETMLELQVETIAAPEHDFDPVSGGSIRLGGPVPLSLLIEFDRGMADHAARRFFDIQEGEPSEDDITDAISELINIIGGNILGLFGPSPGLGLPEVPSQTHPEATGSDLRATFRAEDKAFRIELSVIPSAGVELT